MAAISSINAAVVGAFVAPITTMSASDTITYTPGKKQLLLFTNTTGGSLTATIDGNAGTTVDAPGLGTVSVAAGLAVVVPAGESRGVILSSIRHYLQGVVAITGASTLKVQLFDL